MSGLFRRALATLVAISFVLGQCGPELAATLHASSNARLHSMSHLRPPTVAIANPPVRVHVKELARVKPAMPPASALRPRAVPGVRPASGRHVPGPPMFRPSEIDGALKAAARSRAPMSMDGAPGTPAASGARRSGTPRVPGAPKAQPDTQPAVRRAQSLPSDPNASGTGINPWWRYQEEGVPGGGRIMVNVGTGNLLLQDDDMAVPHKGIAMAFRRTYNSQGAQANPPTAYATWQSLYGNGWTNTFDAHLVQTISGLKSVYDIDGARYDYQAAGGTPMTYVSVTPGQHAVLQSDGVCGLTWTKKSGTIYYFYSPNTSKACPSLGTVGGYAGRLYQIIGRNRNTFITFAYAWDNGNASVTGKISAITATTESGMTATLSFADVNGRRLLQQLTFPDNATTVQYAYDANGDLQIVSHPPNSASGVRPIQVYGYQALGSDFTMWFAASPRLYAACGTGNCYADGGVLWFGYNGTAAANSTVATIQQDGVVNPTIPDGSNGGPIQGTGYPNNTYVYNTEYYTAGVTAPTFRDTDGHMTNWVVDGTGRPTQTQECTASTNQGQQCTGTWLLLNESWDANNNLVSQIDARGYETDFAYDANGNTIAVGEPQTATSQGTFRPTRLYDYDGFNNVVAYCDQTETHQAGADWTSVPVASDSLCASSAVNVPHWHAAFNYPSYEPYGQLASMTTPLGYTHRVTYNPSQQAGADFGLPTSVTGDTITGQFDGTSLTPTQTFWYDGSGNLGCYSKGNGAWVLRYDTLSRLVAVADPDDSSLNGGSICAKASGTAGWNTQTTYSYFPDGSKLSSQSPSERSFNVSSSYTYDLDGNVFTETDHHGCAPNQTCPDGTTQKWYDGVDRLVEVQLPQDPRTYANPAAPGKYEIGSWVTRYFYDLSAGGTVSVTGSAPFHAYGNLYKTQVGLAIPSGLPPWIDKNGTQFDALDREVAKYSWDIPTGLISGEALTSTIETTQLQYDGGSPAALGLLSQKINPRNETASYGYDSRGKILTETYGGDGGRTANESYVYDPNGRAASVTSSQFGMHQYSYDQDGRLSLSIEPTGGGVTDPAQISYSYYGNGSRSAVSVTSSTFNQANAIAYSYRVDGLLQKQTLNAFANGSWSRAYSDAGRLNTQSGVDSQSRTYESTGQLQNYTVGGSTLSFTHDPEGSPITEVIPGSANPSGAVQTLTTTFNLRGELIDSLYTPSTDTSTFPHYRSTNTGGCVTRDSIPNDGSYQQGVSPTMAGFDARSCVIFSNGDMNSVVYSDTNTAYPVGSTNTFTFDTAGRLTQSVSTTSLFDSGGIIGIPPEGITVDPDFGIRASNMPGYAVTSRTTVDTTYDAENHTVSRHPVMVRTQINPANGSTTTRTMDQGTSSIGWGPNGHPLVLQLGNQNPTAPYMTLHWDGDTILFITDAGGNVINFKVGLDGEIAPRDPYQTSLVAYARDAAGVILGSTINGQTTVNPLDPEDGSGPSASMSAYAPYVRPDGFTLGGIQINGVRAFDSRLQSWTSPDAYAGDIHDPASQQKYMWNRGNAVDYEDPSGFLIIGDPNNPLIRSSERLWQALWDLLKTPVPQSWPGATSGCTCGGPTDEPQLSGGTGNGRHDFAAKSGNSGGSSINQMNQQIRRGQAPPRVKRVDKGTQKGEQDQVHFDTGNTNTALNRNGDWKHDSGFTLNNEEKKWLISHGWQLPK